MQELLRALNASGPKGSSVHEYLTQSENLNVITSVIGADDRKEVDEFLGQPDGSPGAPAVLPSPFRHLAALRIRWPTGGFARGTGWFIGPRTVVTAAHNLYDATRGGRAQQIEVIRAVEEDFRPYGVVVSQRFFYPQSWPAHADDNDDYGAVALGTDAFAEAGNFGVAVLADAELTDRLATICGYPHPSPRPLYDGWKLYAHACSCTKTTPTRLQYKIDTSKGQSGSPIWIVHPTRGRVVIGIHTDGEPQGGAGNSGTRITQSVYADIQSWMQAS